MSGLFGRPSNSVQNEVYSGIQVGTSLYGGVLPYIAGRQKTPFNLLWYGGWTVTSGGSGSSKGGGGGGTKTYNYQTALLAGLCIGPIHGIFTIWHDKSLQTLQTENLSYSLGGSGPAIWSYLSSFTPPGATFSAYISGTTMTVTAISGGSIAVNQVISGAGVTAGTKVSAQGALQVGSEYTASGGGIGTYQVYPAQTVGSVGSPVAMTASAGATGSQAIPYDHIAYVASPDYNLGSSAAMPNLLFEVEGVVPGYSDAYGVYDADPSAVIVDYLTDPVHGALAGPGGASIVIGSTDAPLTGSVNSYQAYCMAMGLLTSPYEDTQRGATDFIQELMQCTNSDVVLSYGVLKVIPYADQAVSGTTPDGASWSYTPNLTPTYVFADSDYCPREGEPPVKLTRKPLADTHNIVNVEYLDRGNYYNAAPASASDLNDIALYGPRTMNTLTLHQITNANTAKTVAQLVMQADLYERNTYEFRVRADYSLLEPMNYVSISDSNLGLANQLVRITEVEDDADSFFTIKAMLVPGVVRSTAQYNWQSAQGIYQNYSATPGSVQTPVIFQMPPIPQAAVGGIPIGIAVCGQTQYSAWGGCYVYCSADGGSTYSPVGTISSPAYYGTLTANLAAVADPDTTSTLSIALANTALTLPAGTTHSDADNLRTMMLLGSGATAEVISYGAETLTSAGHYNLSYLRRGLFGSTDQAHSDATSPGNQFVKLDGNIMVLGIDPGAAGTTLYFKFCSFNTAAQAVQQVANVTAYAYTVPSATVADNHATLVPRGFAVVNNAGTTVYKTPAGTSGSWDSDAYSSQPYYNGCFISWIAPTATLSLMCGLGQSPASQSVNESTLDFGLFCSSTGTIGIYELGTSVGSGGSYVAGDAFEVRYDGVTVRYYHNGTLLKGTRAPGLVLYPRVCLETNGAQVNSLAFGPVSGITQPGANWLNSYPWVVGTNLHVVTALGNYQSIALGPTGSAIVLAGVATNPYGPYGDSEPLWLTYGNGTNSADGGWNNTGDLQGIDPTKTYRSCVWFYYTNTGTLSGKFYHGCDTSGATLDLSGASDSNPYFQGGLTLAGLLPNKWYLSVGFIHGSGYGTAAAGIGGVYDPVSGVNLYPATEFKQATGVARQEHRAYLYYTTTVGVALYLARPRFEEVNGNEPSISSLLSPASFVWVSTGTGLGLALIGVSAASKGNGAANTWDTAAYTPQSYAYCHVQAKWRAIADNVMVGLSVNPLASPSYTNLAYAWYNNAGTLQIFESGTLIGSYGSVSLTDRVAITFDGSTVTYLLNGVSQRTASITGTAFHGMVSFYNINGGVNSLSFGPTTTIDVIDTSGLGTNAASQIASAVNSGTQTVSLPVSGTPEDLDAVSVTITATGVPIAVDVSGDCVMLHTNFATPTSGLVTVRRDGSDVGTGQFNIYNAWNNMHTTSTYWEGQVTLSVVDAPSAGSHTYTLHFHGTGAGSSGTSEFEITNATIKVREYRK